MVLGGVAAGLGGFMQNVGGGLGTSVGNNDIIGMWANYAANAGVNIANQAFMRKFSRIDYTIQQQNLHREDIRDLCDLTTGRMDIYLVVGTLLLTFTIAWYTDNNILDSELPTWYITLFLLSNFTASAYLIFSVWLAMHASVAAHSISVRLLTSWARLSIPSVEQLDAIDEWVMPSLLEFLRLGREFFPNAPAPKLSPREPESWSKGGPPGWKSSTQKDTNRKDTNQKDAIVEEDDEELPVKGMVREEHFKRFLYEQRRWLGYDAYARICMCFGMNQMLQALSYYILGIVWQTSPASAITSFGAVKLLSGLVLKLDVNGVDDHGRHRDMAALVCLYMAPPALSCGILWFPLVHDHLDHDGMFGLAAFPIFLLHAAWLIYLAWDLYRGSLYRSDGQEHADPHFMPLRLRTVGYLNILAKEQSTAVAEQKMDYAISCIEHMHEARETLGALMEEAMITESLRKKLSNRSRGKSRLAHSQKTLMQTVQEARRAIAEIAHEPDEDQATEFRRAERVLDRFAVWQQAPEICAVLKAFKEREVQGWLSQEERETVESATCEFLEKCNELGLGLEAVAEEDMELPRVEQEKHIVHITSYNDLFSQPSSLWVATKTGEVLDHTPMPERNRVASFTTAFEVDLPQWNRSAGAAASRMPGAVQRRASSSTQGGPLQRRVTSISRQMTGASVQTEEMQGVATRASSDFVRQDSLRSEFIPDAAMPDERLPGTLVHKMTLGTAALWVVCAFVHASKGILGAKLAFTEGSPIHPATLAYSAESKLRHVATTWPKPASFIEVDSLHCNSGLHEQVFVGSEFSAYVAQRLPSGHLGAFAEVHEMEGRAAAVFCDGSDCSALVPQAAGRPWVLQPIGNRSKHMPALVQVPADWRRMVAAVWKSPISQGKVPDQSKHRSQQARLAAWDGAGVVIADMVSLDAAEPTWSVKPRFRIAPGVRQSLGEYLIRKREQKYDDVRALQLVKGTDTLLVLQGSGVLDAWNIVNGTLLARWQVGGRSTGSFAGMCYDGEELILAQQLPHGPQFRGTEAPTEMQAILRPTRTSSALQEATREMEFSAQAWLSSAEGQVELGGRVEMPM